MTTLSCEEIRAKIVDGDEDAVLRAHVEGCAECRPILAALDDVDADLAALSPIDAPDALVERTIARVQEEQRAESAPLAVGAPSLLAAAFAMLTSAVGALVVAPVIALRWLLGVGTERKDTEPRGRGMGWGPALAMSSVLIGVVAFTTFSRFGSTVKTKTRGAESIVGGLPTASSYESEDEETAGDGWFEANLDRPSRPAPGPSPVAGAQAAMPEQPAGDDFQNLAADPGLLAGDLQQQADSADDGLVLLPTAPPVLALRDESGALGFDGRELAQSVGGGQGGEQSETINGIDDLESQRPDLARAHHGAAMDLPPEPAAADQDGTFDRTLGPVRTPITGEDEGRFSLRGEVDRGGRVAESDGIALRTLEERAQVVVPSPWQLAQATTGLTFASSESWWANSYVPGDARLRVLHARLAASPGALSGQTRSALALAELATPTTPAVAAPTDRALALGVHADTTAIEGPTRVRMEIALRAIDQAAGRRGALRIALVVDARNGLGTEETAHLRALLASLSRSLSPRDRVILTAAGPGGGTLVPLGVLRHGQVEVALRHLAQSASVTSDVPATTLDAALGSGLEAVAVDDDGAGLTLLVTPSGAHDAAVDQALHLGAVAGVPTSAVGIGAGATTDSLDAIALAGEGRRRLVLSDDDAARAVREELSAASRLVARALRVRIHLADGVQLVDVVGSHALDAEETRRTRESERAIDQSLARRLGIGQDRDDDDSGVRILVPSFYAGDSHTIVLDLLVSRPGPVADVDVRFKDLVRLGNGTASSALALEAGTAPRGPHELRVVASYVGHEVAGALDDAASALERGDVSAARTRLTTVRALIDQARAEVEGLASVPTIAADANLLDQFVVAIDGASERGLVAASLHYAAARRIVIPQLQASTP